MALKLSLILAENPGDPIKQGDARHTCSKSLGTGVAHEHFGWVAIEHQETEAASRDHQAECHGWSRKRGRQAHLMQGKARCRQRQRSCNGDRTGQTIDTIRQIN